MAFSLQQVLDQRQTQRLEQIMAPHQIQSLEILMATLPELEQKISEELSENPTLELLETGVEQLAGNPVEADKTPDDIAPVDEDEQRLAEKERLVDDLIKLNEMQRGIPRKLNYDGSEEAEERHQYFWDSLTTEPTIEEVLAAQLRQTEGLTPEELRVCVEIIGSIDGTGYLRTHLADIAITCNASMEEVEAALRIVQEFDPPGIASRDLRECLMLQLERVGEKKSLAYQVVSRHIEDLGKNRLQQIAKDLKVSLSELKDAIRRIRRLRPFPGNEIGGKERTEYVAPEVYIEKDADGEWQVRSNSEYVPRLRISPYYLKLLKDPKTSSETREYIRNKIGGSKLLLRAIENRESTIVRIARTLLEKQLDFFEKGMEYLMPMTMSEVAEAIDVHETTVSRAIANKYVMTPHGLFSFKHFFTTGLATESGEMVSTRTVKQRLKDLVDSEDRKKPLSDKVLTDKLAEDGFKVARRTIAKYREELGIPPSNLRKSF
jgi:RNA polymerase sigma-54 factor